MTMLRESDSCVFLLGAGATCAFGYPVMNDFSGEARRRYFYYKKFATEGSTRMTARVLGHYNGMFEFQEQCRSSSDRFDRNWENIEELFTQADLLRSLGSERAKAAEEWCTNISWAIWDVYRPRYREHRDLDTLRKALMTCSKIGLLPIVITTNYDLTPEIALSRYHYSGFLADPTTGDPQILVHADSASNLSIDQMARDGSVPVIKIHGSVNWFRLANDKTIAWPYFVGDSQENTDGNRLMLGGLGFSAEHLDALARKMHGSSIAYRPHIVPPMLSKVTTDSLIRAQWEAAVEALSRARQIWVVGYSFPSTDPFMTRLLFEGLRSNRDIDHFCIVDRQSPDEWKDRLEVLFSPTFRRNKLFFIQSDAQDFFKSARGSLSPRERQGDRT